MSHESTSSVSEALTLFDMPTENELNLKKYTQHLDAMEEKLPNTHLAERPLTEDEIYKVDKLAENGQFSALGALRKVTHENTTVTPRVRVRKARKPRRLSSRGRLIADKIPRPYEDGI